MKTKVYVAGSYSADNVIDVLGNIRKGISVSAAIMNMGFAVFSPWLDFQLALSSYGACLIKEDYQENSMAWLEVSDCVFVLPNSEKSRGVKREIIKANKLGIPVYYKIEYLKGV
jgi:hypothetical protein